MSIELKLKNVRKSFSNGTLALDDISLRISKGEFVVILGPSGSGKTTFIRTLNGLEKITNGYIEIKSTPNKLVLIAPTWSHSRFGNTQAGLDLVAFFKWLKQGRLNSFIDNDIHLVIRPHPITSDYLDKSLKNVSVADASLIEIIEPYLSAFDLVVSDYSALLADAAFVNVPALAYIEGIDKFKTNKGLYDGVQELLEGIGVASFQDLYDHLIFNKSANQVASKKLVDFFFDERLKSYENHLFHC